MQDFRLILINNSLSKSKTAYEDANFNFENKRYATSLNRSYYAIFYCVTALAYKDGFATSKHKQLMGWFNKKYIYENKVFCEDLVDIYIQAYKERQESDYEMLNIKKTNLDTVRKALDDTKYFIDTIFEYIKKEMNLDEINFIPE